MHHFRIRILTAIFLPFLAQAQEKHPIEMGADLELKSNYIWRGLATGHPYAAATLDLGWKGLSASAYGLTGLGMGGDLKEIDLTLKYEWSGLSFGFNDYWDNSGGTRYFSLRPSVTGHVLEAFISYDFGPVSVSWSTHIAGNDRKEDGSRNWSSYLELKSAAITLLTFQWQAHLGITPWASGFYQTKGFSVRSIGISVSKNLIETELFTIPVVLDLIAHPVTRNLYFVIGTGLSF